MPNFRYFQIHAIKDHITFNKLGAKLELSFTIQNYKSSLFKSVTKHVTKFCPTIGCRSPEFELSDSGLRITNRF